MPSVEYTWLLQLNPNGFSDLRSSEHGQYRLWLLSSESDQIPSIAIPKDRSSAKTPGLQ